jgi:hypothetical protein
LKLRVIHLVKLSAGHNLGIVFRKHADPAGQRFGCQPVIAGDHHHADPASFADLHRLGNFWSSRVEHRHQTQESQLAFHPSRGVRSRPGRQPPESQRQDAQSPPGIRVILSQDLRPQVFIQHADFLIAYCLVAQLQHFTRRSFDEGNLRGFFLCACRCAQ